AVLQHACVGLVGDARPARILRWLGVSLTLGAEETVRTLFVGLQLPACGLGSVTSVGSGWNVHFAVPVRGRVLAVFESVAHDLLPRLDLGVECQPLSGGQEDVAVGKGAAAEVERRSVEEIAVILAEDAELKNGNQSDFDIASHPHLLQPVDAAPGGG